MAETAFNPDFVSRLRTGDPDAQDHFVRHFQPVVCGWLSKRVRSSQLRQDVSQDTFARIFSFLRAGGEIERPERLGAFVTAVTRNTLREKFRENRPGTDQPFENLPLVDGAPGADDVLITQERDERIRAAMSNLTARDREILERVFFEGANRDVVCRQMGVDRDYLRVLLHRAVNNFRLLMKRFDTVRH